MRISRTPKGRTLVCRDMPQTEKAEVVDKSNKTVALSFLTGSYQNAETHAPYKSDWYNMDTLSTLKNCSVGDELTVTYRERPQGGSLQVMEVTE